jgi:membrane associated rhomboid family serine protease
MSDISEAAASAENDWRPLPARLEDSAVAVTLAKEQARLWALTLQARKIPCRLLQAGGGWQLLVPPEYLAAALDELRRFEAENRNWPPPLPPATALLDNLLITLSVLALLATFHNIVHYHLTPFGLPSVDWIGRGNAAAGPIRSGEVWRAITALTLHADGLHLLGNLLIGGAFIALLCRTLGSGLGWALLLASGILGNLLNAVAQDALHRSVGASTAVFGAVGLLAALNLLHAGGGLRKRWHLSLVAALALLALLGSEGENTDLGAHLFGFAAGLALGLPTGRLLASHGRPGPWLDAALGLAALALVGGAWWAALHFS